MKYDIEALKRKMLVKYPFFGSVVSGVKYKEETSAETVKTDGTTIYYNPDFLEKLSVEEQIFVFAHEVCHIAFNHILRSEGKNLKVWNIVTDAVINQFLKRDGLKMAKGGVDMPEAINYDAEHLYNIMIQQQQQYQICPIQDKQDVGDDTHSLWEDAVKKHREEQKKSSGKMVSLVDKILNRKKSEQPKEKTEIEKKQEELVELGEKEAFKKNSDEKKYQLEKLKQSIAKRASMSGISTNRNVRSVSDIGTAKSIIDWRYVLREAITYEVDWSYKNATLEEGILTANLEEILTPETEIVLDTSGSINEVLLKNFLRECKNILQQSRVKVGCFDTEFYGFHEIRTEEDIENMKFDGGGGTDFNVAVNAFSRRVENKIIFTDGEALMPDVSLDIIWIVFGDKKINPKGGRVINITGKQLDRLYSYEIGIPSNGRAR